MSSYRHRLSTIILFLSDIVILFFIVALAGGIRYLLPSIIPDFPVFYTNAVYVWWFLPIWITILIFERAYTAKFTFWDEVKVLWKVSLFSTLTVLTILFLTKLSIFVSRTFIVLIGIISVIVFPILRLTVKRWLIKAGLLTSNVLILGANETGKRTLRALRREPNLGYEVVGFIDDSPDLKGQRIEGVKIHGYINEVERYVKNCDVQDVVIALDQMERNDLIRLVNGLQHKVRSVLYVPDFSGLAVIGTELRHFFHDQFLAVEIKNNLAQPLNYYAKRSFDYIVGIALLMMLLIPLAAISALIMATSRGPALYRQHRVGKNGKRFLCYKFRTMYIDADERLRDILEKSREAKAVWEKYRKLKNDPRITPLGKFLRETSLDELPQILNVLLGEMSLVGPRPVTQSEIEGYYKESADLCFSVLPGITGLWQTSGRSDTSYDHRISLDSWYVRNWNLWLDIVILIKTLSVVLKKEGAR